MATLCKPTLRFPEHVVSQDNMVDAITRLYPDHPKLGLVIKMIRNTQVATRRMITPLDMTMTHPGTEYRHKMYASQGKRLTETAAAQAIRDAGLAPGDIDAVIAISCTGFLMPSLTAHLINALGLNAGTTQLPIAQMGCAGGVTGVNTALKLCHAAATAEYNVLIVALELSSLCFQPDDSDLSALIAASLFGDCASAVVMRKSDHQPGFRISNADTHFLHDTEDYIYYDIKDTGYHFRLNKRVMESVSQVAPVIRTMNRSYLKQEVDENAFLIYHTGGRRILDALVTHLELDSEAIERSRKSLSEYGNIASAVVFDVLRRYFERPPATGSKGMMLAFGPGFTTEACFGEWAQSAA